MSDAGDDGDPPKKATPAAGSSKRLPRKHSPDFVSKGDLSNQLAVEQRSADELRQMATHLTGERDAAIAELQRMKSKYETGKPWWEYPGGTKPDLTPAGSRSDSTPGSWIKPEKEPETLPNRRLQDTFGLSPNWRGDDAEADKLKRDIEDRKDPPLIHPVVVPHLGKPSSGPAGADESGKAAAEAAAGNASAKTPPPPPYAPTPDAAITGMMKLLEQQATMLSMFQRKMDSQEQLDREQQSHSRSRHCLEDQGRGGFVGGFRCGRGCG